MSGVGAGQGAQNREHGSDFRRFVRGEWPCCVCGFNPRDNQALNAHFEAHGFREVDVHGTIVREPVVTPS